MGWLMGLEPTTTGITIGKIEKTSVLENIQEKYNQSAICF